MGDDTLKKDMLEVKGVLKEHTTILDEHTKMLDRLDKSQTKMAVAIVNLQKEMKEVKETMATKDDIRQVISGNDTVVKMLSTLLQEKVFTDARIARIDETQNIHSKDIQKLKLVTGLA